MSDDVTGFEENERIALAYLLRNGFTVFNGEEFVGTLIPFGEDPAKRKTKLKLVSSEGQKT